MNNFFLNKATIQCIFVTLKNITLGPTRAEVDRLRNFRNNPIENDDKVTSRLLNLSADIFLGLILFRLGFQIQLLRLIQIDIINVTLSSFSIRSSHVTLVTSKITKTIVRKIVTLNFLNRR